MVVHEHDDLREMVSDDMIPPDQGLDDDVEVPDELDEWVDDTKGVERVVTVAITTSKPRTADWVAEQAMVSESTARDHLETFADVGIIKSFKSSGVTRYYADEGFIHYREVSRCVDQYTKEELSEQIEQTQATIQQIKEAYEVEEPDDLRAKAAEEGVEVSDIREYKKTAADWETLSDKLDVLEDATRRFEKFDRHGKARV